MELNDRVLNATATMCYQKMAENSGLREWFVADIASFLRHKRYDELDELFNHALTESFTSREAEKRYFLAWTQMCNPLYDLEPLVEAGPEGLKLIKAWQDARPRSTHAWLAEVQYWNHRAWLYRSYGWARDTTQAMWICASACNEQMMIAAINAIDCDPRQWMAASLANTNAQVFGFPDWMADYLQGNETVGTPGAPKLAAYHQHSPQEIDALMAFSGLSLDNAVCPSLPRPSVLLTTVDDLSFNYWLTVCLRIFPTAYSALGEYLPFRMPRWNGTHQEINEFLASGACAHLSDSEREHLELLIWWDEYRDLSVKEIEELEIRTKTIAKAQAVACHARNQEDRHNALGWLLNCYDDLDDEAALWACIQHAVMEKKKLDNYFTYQALKFALRDFPNSHWIYNFICQNAEHAEGWAAVIYRGYFQRAGLFGFEKNTERGNAWLDRVSSIQHSATWKWTIRSFGWLNRPEYCVPLAEVGAERNIPGALQWLADEYNNRDNGTLVPYQTRTALKHYQRAARILLDHIAQRDNTPWRLIANGGYSEYEADLRDIYFSLAICHQRLCMEDDDSAKWAGYEKNLLNNLWQAHQLGHEQAKDLFLLNIFEVSDLTLAHAHLALLEEEANKGTLQAMVTLARLYGNEQDKQLFNIKKSARWTHFADTLYPDNEIVRDCLYKVHFDTRWKRMRYTWHTVRIPASELPGQVNPMV